MSETTIGRMSFALANCSFVPKMPMAARPMKRMKRATKTATRTARLAVLCSYVGCTREPAVKMGLWENTTTQTTKTTGTIPQRMAQEMHQRGMPPDSSFQRFKFPISRFPGTMGLLPISR